MNNYCTLFDSRYLIKGIAMYNSLLASGEDFFLYIFAFDELAEKTLKNMNLKNVLVIGLNDFETEELLKVKNGRTKCEYCWTCTSFTIAHVFDRCGVAEVTYIDADLYFYNNPGVLLDEFRRSNGDVMLTEHRFFYKYLSYQKTSGTYCVQFMSFKNNENGRKILRWWQDRCIEWCFSYFEDGKLGDQKYLDDWTERFTNVHVLENLGGGVAPWNVENYECSEGPCIDGQNIVFYHYHGFRWRSMSYYDIGIYKHDANVEEYLYKPYLRALKKAMKQVKRVDNKYKYFFEKDEKKIVCYLENRIKRNVDKDVLKSIFNNIFKAQNSVIWGAGHHGKLMYEWLKEKNIDVMLFIDKSMDKQKKLFCGRKVISPQSLEKYSRDNMIVIVATENYLGEIYERLDNLGYSSNTIYFEDFYKQVLAEYLNKKVKWIYDYPKH